MKIAKSHQFLRRFTHSNSVSSESSESCSFLENVINRLCNCLVLLGNILNILQVLKICGLSWFSEYYYARVSQARYGSIP